MGILDAPAFNGNDNGYDVILLAGQSNMVGQGVGLDTAYLDVPDVRIQQYAGSGVYLGQIVTAVDPLFHRNSSAVGHAMTFAREYVRTIPSNRRVLLVPAACSGTGFTTTTTYPAPTGYRYYSGTGAGTWDPAPTDGGSSLYENAIAQANAALALSSKNRLVAILWHQGEADAGTLTQSQYAAKLDALIAGFRSRITGASSVPFILGQMLPDFITANGAGATAINLAHIDTPNRNIRAAFAYGPAGLQNGDNTHYSAAGQRALGQAVVAALAIARANVTGVAPIAPASVSLAQSGTSVIVTWTRPLGRATDYKVEYNTGSSWTQLTRSQSIDNSATITGLTLGSSLQVRVSTINEQGTSSPSSAATITLASLPGQVTGLAAGTPLGTSVPLSWTMVSGATSYKIESSPSGANTWTTRNTVTTTSGSAVGLAISTAYDFRVTAMNAAGSGTVSATVSATTATSSALLSDIGVAAYRAYGLRRLNDAAVKAINVRRSSDNTTQDIGFTSAGLLDTTSLLSFVGSGSGYIQTWYDQSGNARDLSQTTTANQAQIVNAGTLNTAPNGKPAAVFNGSSTYYLDTSSIGLYAAGAASFLFVGKTATTSTHGVVGEGSNTSNGSRYVPIYVDSSSRTGASIYDEGASQFLATATGSAFASNAIAQVSVVDTGVSYQSFNNATTSGSVSYVRNGRTMALAKFAVGAVAVGSTPNTFFNGQIDELVCFATTLSTTQRQAGEANQKAFWGTP